MKSLVDISKNLVGRNFLHCSPSIDKGLDCFRLCIEYLRMKGAKIPEDTIYKGYKIFDYIDIYDEDPIRTMKLARDFIGSITREVKVGYEFAGDILAMHTKKKIGMPLHLGIEAGNGQVIVAIRGQRVKLVNKNLFIVEKVFRWEPK